MTPYLQLLLNRKKTETYQPQPLGTGINAGGESLDLPIRPTPVADIPQTTIPISRPMRPSIATPPPVVRAQPAAIAAQPPAIPLAPRPSMEAPDAGGDMEQAPSDPWQGRIEADRQRILNAQAHPQSTGKRILEALGTWAGAGVGLPVQKILHPHGTETQQAQRQLATDVGLQQSQIEAQTKAQRAQTEAKLGQADAASQYSTIALRNKQIAKIDDEINNPDLSDAAKAELEAIKEGVRAFEGQAPSGENDRAYADLRAKAAKRGITLPATYGPKAQPAKAPETHVVNGVVLERQADGTLKPVYTAPEKPEPEVPDTTGNWSSLESGFRDNATKANTAADKAEADVKRYIREQQFANPQFDPAKDANVASMTAEARRQRDFAKEQTQKADHAAFKKTEASAGDTKARAKKPYRGGGSKYVAPKVSASRLSELMK